MGSDSALKTRLVVAFEETLLREALSELLSRRGRHEVIGSCGDGFAALQLIQSMRPEVAVVDLDLPILHTMELLAKLQPLELGVRMIVITSQRDRKSILEVLRCGAHGIVMRSGPASHLFDAIEHTRNGGIYITPLLSLDKVFVARKTGKEADPLARLSTREYQVFSMLVSGMRPKEIASRLDLSPKTIDTYRSSMMKKLDIHDVASLVKLSMQRNTSATA
jgi:DNA-binding NarL/FixJ family response regulator